MKPLCNLLKTTHKALKSKVHEMNIKNCNLLLKKQLLDAMPTKNRKEKFFSNWAGTLLMGALIAVIIAVFVVIFRQFTTTYTAIKINRIPDVAQRQYELMSIIYFALIIVFVLSGVASLCHSLFENSDLNILITMPFSGTEIFLSKLIGVFLKQTAIAFFVVPVVNFTFLCTTNTLTVFNGIMTFVVALTMPILPLAIASLIVLPYYYLKRIVQSHYLLTFAVMTAIMVLFCVAYSFIFKIAQQVLTSGQITNLFNEKTMASIITFTKYCYPANLIASLMLGKEIGKNIGILAAILVVAIVLTFVVVRAVFIKVSHSSVSFHIPHAQRKEYNPNKLSRLGSLMGKEFLLVIRTPSYAYMYFTTAVIMPIMAYYSAKISLDVLSNLVGNVDMSFEVCTFIVLLYSTLTNTFCSTNISRDGYMTMMQKTLPFSPTHILGSKMIFCSIISVVSILVATITLGATGMESVVNCVVTFVSATLLAFAQIVLATRMDLHRPHFSKTEDGEIKEANSTVSSIITIGLVASFVIGFALLFSALKAIITGSSAVETNLTLSYSLSICLPALLLGLSLVYFFVNLKRDYANLDSEG